MVSLLRYIDGDYNDPATFKALDKTLEQVDARCIILPSPPVCSLLLAKGVVNGGMREGCSRSHRKTVWARSGDGTTIESNPSQFFLKKTSSALIISSAKSRSKIFSYTRFGNPIFEPLWNRNYIRSIQITLAESLGVEDRGRFYDETGAIRDVVQNHLFQVLANLAMDPPGGNAQRLQGDRKKSCLRPFARLHPIVSFADNTPGIVAFQEWPAVLL